MIRGLAIAAAAAAVGYKLGQRASADTQSRFSQPEVTGDDVSGKEGVVEDDLNNPIEAWHENREDIEVNGL